MMCTFIIFLGVNFSVTAQCLGGMTVTMSSDLTTTNTAIPFGTPIVVTTTITNNNSTPRSVTLNLALSVISTGSQYDVLCAGDYTWNGGFNAQRNITNIQPGASVVSTITLVYRQTFLRSTSPAGSFVIATIFGNNIPTCNTTLGIQHKDPDAVVLGAPNSVTTVNNLLNLTAEGSLIIRGTVILDVNHILKPIGNGLGVIFPYIYMDEGATLVIPSGRTLQLKGARVFGIRSMWNSIIVESGGSLVTELGSDGLNTVFRRTSIEDGMRAIEASNGSNISISSTNFEDNIRSFFVPPTTGALQSINFNTAFYACDFNGTGYLKPLPTSTPNCNTNEVYGYPFAGMDINDLGSLITVGALRNVPKTRFRNLSNGILARRTRLFVNQTRFENINSAYSGFDGLGIWSRDPNSLLLVAGDPNSTAIDFQSCTQGIIYENFGVNDLAQINALRMDNTQDLGSVGVGIRSVNNNGNQSFIYANNIRAKTGIISAWNRFNGLNAVGEIYNNLIEPTDPTNPASSVGIVSYDNSTTGNWNIYNNTLDVQNAQFGMQFYSGTGARLTNNQIVLEPNSHINSCGILASGSSNLNASCNDISGAGVANSTYRSAMYISNGTGSSYTCNNVGATEVGFNITGEMRPFAMSANRFNNHSVGLVINDATFIGLQFLEGNKWQGPFSSGIGAELINPTALKIFQNRFRVGSTTPLINPTTNAPNWFQFVNGADATCTSLNACPNGNPAGRVASVSSNDESFYTSAISAELMQTPNAEEMKWTAQRNAYGRLMDNPSHQNNRDKTNFIGRMRNAGTGQLYQVEKGVKDIQNIGQEFNDVLMVNANAIKTLANEIAELDAKIFTTKDVDKKALMAQKKEKNATIYRLSSENEPRHATIERKRNQEIQRLMRENDRISTRLQPEINEKEVNRVYLETVAQGKMTLSREQKITVRDIAFQCPSRGGNAVFAARSLYSLVENVQFDDLALCNARSESVQGLVAKRGETNYKISPNPATDMLTVSQESEKAEAGDWMIFDTAGKSLLTKQVSEGEINAIINIQHLSEGIYFVSFIVNRHKQFTQKFIKIKSN